MRKLKAADEDVDMMLDLAVRPGPGQSNSSRVKNILSDSQLWQNNVILRDVSNDFAISEENVSFEMWEISESVYFEIFPGTPLTLVTPPVCDVLPMRTFTKVAAASQLLNQADRGT